MVIFRSFSLSRVLDAIRAGTEHPKPMSMGIKERPLNPNWRKIRSMTKATRAMYPLSSRKDRSRNSTSTRGKNPATEPIPSRQLDTSPTAHAEAPAPSARPITPSARAPQTVSTIPASHTPGLGRPSINRKFSLKVHANIRYIITAKIGRARIRLVSILSSLSDLVSLYSRRAFWTHSPTTLPMYW